MTDGALPADHRRIRPNDLGSPIRGLAAHGLGSSKNTTNVKSVRCHVGLSALLQFLLQPSQVAMAIACPATRPENRQPPRNVPSSDR